MSLVLVRILMSPRPLLVHNMSSNYGLMREMVLSQLTRNG